MLDLQESSAQCPSWDEPTPDGGDETGALRVRVVLPVIGMRIAETVIRCAISRVASVSVYTTAGRETEDNPVE